MTGSPFRGIIDQSHKGMWAGTMLHRSGLSANRAGAPLARTLAKGGLIVAMTVGSLVLWIGVPVAWLWLGSQLTDFSHGQLGIYVLVAAGTIGSMIGIGKVLAQLNVAYSRLSGKEVAVRIQFPWMRSMRGERHAGIPATALDVIMVISVGIALVT